MTFLSVSQRVVFVFGVSRVLSPSLTDRSLFAVVLGDGGYLVAGLLPVRGGSSLGQDRTACTCTAHWGVGGGVPLGWGSVTSNAPPAASISTQQGGATSKTSTKCPNLLERYFLKVSKMSRGVDREESFPWQGQSVDRGISPW